MKLTSRDGFIRKVTSIDCYHDNNIEDRYDEKGNLKSNCDYCNQENCKERDADFVARD